MLDRIAVLCNYQVLQSRKGRRKWEGKERQKKVRRELPKRMETDGQRASMKSHRRGLNDTVLRSRNTKEHKVKFQELIMVLHHVELWTYRRTSAFSQV